MGELMTTEELAKYLGMHQDVLRRMARAGRLPCFKLFGTRFRFRKPEIDEWIEVQRHVAQRRKEEQAEQIAEANRRAGIRANPTLSRLAELYGVSRSYYSQVRHGKIKKGKKLGPDWRQLQRGRERYRAAEQAGEDSTQQDMNDHETEVG